MKKEQLVLTLAEQLRAVQAERHGAKRDPALLAARTALKTFQSQRLAVTHADLLAAADSHDAAVFFFEELYGAHDLSQRDADLERIIPTMQRLLPVNALQAITEAIVLDALSERLDTQMARQLGTHFGEADYIAAYRGVTAEAERARQLELVQALGMSLCELVRIPFLSTTLTVMRGPARLAGLGDLQQFLERGFNAFKRMRRAERFVHAIVERERLAMQRIYAGHDAPFSGLP
jgi:coenzyme F420-reducing hydrogenase delta subunit